MQRNLLTPLMFTLAGICYAATPTLVAYAGLEQFPWTYAAVANLASLLILTPATACYARHTGFSALTALNRRPNLLLALPCIAARLSYPTYIAGAAYTHPIVNNILMALFPALTMAVTRHTRRSLPPIPSEGSITIVITAIGITAAALALFAQPATGNQGFHILQNPAHAITGVALVLTSAFTGALVPAGTNWYAHSRDTLFAKPPQIANPPGAPAAAATLFLTTIGIATVTTICALTAVFLDPQTITTNRASAAFINGAVNGIGFVLYIIAINNARTIGVQNLLITESLIGVTELNLSNLAPDMRWELLFIAVILATSTVGLTYVAELRRPSNLDP